MIENDEIDINNSDHEEGLNVGLDMLFQSENDSENETSEIEENEEIVALTDKASNPLNLPEPGDRIVFFDPDLDMRVNASIAAMHRTSRAQWPGWRNIIADNGRKQSVNLHVISNGCVVWRYNYKADDGQEAGNAPQDDESHGIVLQADEENQNVDELEEHV